MSERLPFWLLAIFLCIAFFTGGSSWDSEPQLVLLRPLAIILVGCAVFTLRLHQIKRYWVVLSLFMAAALLTAAHLVPLPYSWWSALPGREIIVSVDELAGLGRLSRPLSMSPDATLNTLYALSIPFAVLLLAMQLSLEGHRRIFVLLIALAALSGLFGAIQAGGSSITFYPEQSQTAGLFANRNHQGALLALFVPMAVAFGSLGVARRKDAVNRALFPIVAIVIVIPLLLITGSRSALAVAAVGLIFSLLIWVTRDGGNDQSGGRDLIPPLILVMGVSFLVYVTGYASRDIAIERFGGLEDDLRLPVWRSIVDMLGSYMPWGTGIGSYSVAYQVLEPDKLLRPRFSNHAHNEFLEIALTAGVPGVILLVIASAALIFSLYRAFSKKNHVSPRLIFSQLGLSMLVLLAIASASDYPTRTPILAAIMALASVWASMGGKGAADEIKSNQGLK